MSRVDARQPRSISTMQCVAVNRLATVKCYIFALCSWGGCSLVLNCTAYGTIRHTIDHKMGSTATILLLIVFHVLYQAANATVSAQDMMKTHQVSHMVTTPTQSSTGAAPLNPACVVKYFEELPLPPVMPQMKASRHKGDHDYQQVNLVPLLCDGNFTR